ncbi:hypothetical protein J6590_092449 [Homalodisca vitripennis]|nr:hypothetical protein J6590_092449 [Homalodisca vitripennis]
MTHVQFRKSLVKDLVASKLAQQMRRRGRHGRPTQGQGTPPAERLNKNPHFIQKRPKGTATYVVCLKKGLRKETVYSCKTCTDNPALDPETINSATVCEVHSEIRFLSAKNLSAAKIHRQICKDGRDNIRDEDRSSRPSLVTDDLMVLVEARIRENRRFTITGLSNEFPEM